MRFEFAAAGRIVFGCGAASELAGFMREFGSRAFVVTGSGPKRHKALLDSLAAVEAVRFAVSGEPSVSTVAQAVEPARASGCDVVVGIGGGSVIDTAKAVAALLTNPGEVMEYLEVVGQGRPLVNMAAPCIAVPTTAGTGSEVTRNAVLSVPDKHVKVSMRSAGMLPRIAVIDPYLTRSMPPELTAATGMDALTQLIEPYVCTRANPLTDGICIEGLTCAARSLRTAYEDGEDMGARQDMAVASLFGGLALANAGLGAVHGLAGPLGGMTPAPHGVICGRLLAAVMRTNLHVLRRDNPDSPALGKYARIARILTGNPDAAADDGPEWVARLTADLEIPSIRSFGLTTTLIPDAAQQARQASSMKANPAVLTQHDLKKILTECL